MKNILFITFFFFISCKQEKPICHSVDACMDSGLRIESEALPKALRYFYKACELDSGAGCYHAARIQAKRGGILKAAYDYAEISCAKNYAPGCFLRATLAHQNGDLFLAKKYYGNACQLSHKSACHYLGNLK